MNEANSNQSKTEVPGKGTAKQIKNRDVSLFHTKNLRLSELERTEGAES
jgi:hypothetical protein